MESNCWITSYGDDGERYSYPAEWNAAGYFEDWHDGSVEARSTFDSVVMAQFGMIRPTI